jgi:hypothetical protein|tara:strand:- start:63 stop:296 length:234 start_codon:yes stop_codon:yes gene_type:complete
MTNTELNKEIIDILDNVMYWETCPKNYKVRIEVIKKQLTLTDVVVPKGTFYCYNKEKGFNHSLCEVSQCKNCKQLEK